MKTYTNMAKIREELLASLDGNERGIRVRATSMGSGSHKYWLTGDLESYEVHCYGSGRGWCDQGDDCGIQDLEELTRHLWKKRAQIVEPEYVF